MTVEGTNQKLTIKATVDLTGDILYKALTLNGTIAAGTSQVGGVAVSKAGIDQGVTVVREGHTKVKVGAAVTTIGYPIINTTSGFFIAASSGGAHIGRALAAAASGDLCPALVDFNTINDWIGV